MDDRALYQTILGLQAPWDVERVELRTDPQEVDVWVGTSPTTERPPVLRAISPRSAPLSATGLRPWRWTCGSPIGTPSAPRTFFRGWYGWAMRSRLEPMKKVARMLKAHLENILTYLTHRITNAVTEGINAKMQWITYGARGSRNREAFKMAIYFHRGG